MLRINELIGREEMFDEVGGYIDTESVRRIMAQYAIEATNNDDTAEEALEVYSNYLIKEKLP